MLRPRVASKWDCYVSITRSLKSLVRTNKAKVFPESFRSQSIDAESWAWKTYEGWVGSWSLRQEKRLQTGDWGRNPLLRSQPAHRRLPKPLLQLPSTEDSVYRKLSSKIRTRRDKRNSRNNTTNKSEFRNRLGPWKWFYLLRVEANKSELLHQEAWRTPHQLWWKSKQFSYCWVWFHNTGQSIWFC